MIPSSRSQLRRLVIQEYYRTSLVDQLYEQEAPAPADPAATGAQDDVSVDPTADAAAAAPPAAPPASGAPTPAAPINAPAVDPTASAVAGAPPASPIADPSAMMGSSPAPLPASAPPAAISAPAAPTPAPPAPGTTSAANSIDKSTKFKTPPPGSTASKVADAAAAAISAAEDDVSESLRRRSLGFLMEQDTKEPNIDMGVYASKIANLIKNYTSLIDVKKNVIDQAEKFLNDQFPKSAETLKKQLKDLLRKEYHISLERPELPPDSYAVGAKSGGGGAA